MSREERKKFESLHSPYNKFWIPCVWFTNLAAVARCEGRIKDDHTLTLLLEVQNHNHIHWWGDTVLVFWLRSSFRSTQTEELNKGCKVTSACLCVCVWTGAEWVQREVQHAVSLRHDQRSPSLHSGELLGRLCAWFLHWHLFYPRANV